jgi:hypothetical protein
VNQEGEFAVAGLPPEHYLAIAVPRRVIAATDAARLDAYRSRATPVLLPEGLTRGLELSCLWD